MLICKHWWLMAAAFLPSFKFSLECLRHLQSFSSQEHLVLTIANNRNFSQEEPPFADFTHVLLPGDKINQRDLQEKL